MLETLAELRDRTIYRVTTESAPAVYYIADKDAGGILVNAPTWSTALAATLRDAAEPAYLFLPSRFGVRDVEAWRGEGLETLAWEPEVAAIDGSIDTPLNSKVKLTRTIDFLPMSGRTAGSCALRLKNKPGAIFFGPILEPGEEGWPTLVLHDDDYSSESRLFGALGLQDVTFDYAFTDTFDPATTRYGPGAGEAVNAAIAGVLEGD
jgi:hypothetical protein